MPISKYPTTNLQPVLDAIADLKSDVSELGTRMNRLESRIDGLEGEMKQQGMLMRAMARVILPEDVMATTLSDRELEEEIVRKDADEKRRLRRESQMRGGAVGPR